MKRLNITVMVLTTLLYAGCSTAQYIATPCPSVKVLPKVGNLDYDVHNGVIDKKDTPSVESWIKRAAIALGYYRPEIIRLNKETL